MSRGINILIDRALGRIERGRFDSLGKFSSRRLHQWRMESSTHLEWSNTLHTHLHELGTSGLYSLHGTRNDYLTWAVEVGSHHSAVDRSTDFLNLLIAHHDIALQNCSHRAGHLLTAFLHCLSTLAHQLQTILERQSARCYQCRKFTQRMSGNHIRLDASYDSRNN